MGREVQHVVGPSLLLDLLRDALEVLRMSDVDLDPLDVGVVGYPGLATRAACDGVDLETLPRRLEERAADEAGGSGHDECGQGPSHRVPCGASVQDEGREEHDGVAERRHGYRPGSLTQDDHGEKKENRGGLGDEHQVDAAVPAILEEVTDGHDDVERPRLTREEEGRDLAPASEVEAPAAQEEQRETDA